MAWAIAKGKWAVCDGRVGIINAVMPGFEGSPKDGVPPVPPSVEFHVTGADGTTTRVETVPVESVRCPRANELPAARVAHLSAEDLSRMGYR